MKTNIKVYLTVAIIILSLFSAPLAFVSAQTNGQDLQAIILQLQEQIKSLQAQIEQLKSELTAAKSELTEVKAELKFTRTLYRGVSGDDVLELQEFLKQFSDVYPEGLVTGYFGPLTEAAVKRLQEKENIVSGGTSVTTGYGQVGPKTLAKLNEIMTSGTGGSGLIPPGLTTTPVIQDIIEATTTPTTPTTTPSGMIPAIPAIPAEPATPPSGGGGGATPATPATPAEPTTLQDTTSPIISNLQATSITETSATITWTTNESASGEIYYAASSTPIFATSTTKVIGADSVTSHNINLSNLVHSTTYYYVVVSKDASGNTATSSEQSFATLTPPKPISDWSSHSLNVSGEYQSTAWNGNGYGVVYGWNGKLYFLKLDLSGNKLGEPIIVATAPNYVFWTNIVWDGSKYGVVWPEANPHNIRFATLDIDGNVLSNIAVTAGTDNASTEKPAILWTGNEYILVWSGGWPDNFNNPYLPTEIIYFSKIASDGQTVIVNKKKSITSGDARAANGSIVSAYLNGSNVGVLWQDIRDSGDSNNPALYFNILDNNGDKLISNDVKVSGVGRVGSPQIFAEGANYIVFWRESTASDVNANSIYVAKLDSVGNKILANQNLNTKGDNEIRLSVTKTDNGYGIAWISSSESKIYFKSISSNASIIIDNELVSTQSGNNDGAYMVWGSNKYGIVWENVLNNQSQLYFGIK